MTNMAPYSEDSVCKNINTYHIASLNIWGQKFLGIIDFWSTHKNFILNYELNTFVAMQGGWSIHKIVALNLL